MEVQGKAATRTSSRTKTDVPQPKPKAPRTKSQLSKSNSVDVYDDDREPIKAFLRLRPYLGEDQPLSTPYLDAISDTAVRMMDPSSSTSHTRMSTVSQPATYTFSHIFPDETSQSEFFEKTTLPLIKDVLEGQSALLFAYGVTNSGKTYTIQGGGSHDSAGILPRTLDVLFNSIEKLHGDGRFQPVRLQGVEASESSSHEHGQNTRRGGKAATGLEELLDDSSDTELQSDDTALRLDRNHEYTIWLSYAEVYNEKVYDLFASIENPSASPTSQVPSGIPRPTSSFLHLPVQSSHSNPVQVTRKALSVKPCPASDGDSTHGGKYVAGLRQLRVHSASQAKSLLRLGQLHRRVFGTLANSQSSRSHAMVTIKVLRVHRGERNDPTSIQVSRLTLVDLAGSERTKHTNTTGERLKEAGNINKSLMVLGQCMETMRSNQRTVARSLAANVGSGNRTDTRDVKKALAVVPFRHSKLTEILMDYFVGEGRVTMIVNVNPFDTGYDENSHVMKFSALAREVSTTIPTAIPRPVPLAKITQAKGQDNSYRRKVTLSMGGAGRKATEAHLEVLEEDEEPGNDDEGDDEPINPLVDALFDEIESLRMQLFESEMRCAIVEAEVREEVIQEMTEQMQNMEKVFTRRLMKEVEQNERKMDAKIDVLQRAGLLGQSANADTSESGEEFFDVDDEEDEEEEGEEIGSGQTTQVNSQATDAWMSDGDRSPSPLAGKAKRTASKVPKAKFEDNLMDVDETPSSTQSTMVEDEEATPLPIRRTLSKGNSTYLNRPPSPVFEEDVKAETKRGTGTRRTSRKASSSLSKLEKELNALSIGEQPTVIKPTKSRTSKKSSIAAISEEDDGGRQLRRSTRTSGR